MRLANEVTAGQSESRERNLRHNWVHAAIFARALIKPNSLAECSAIRCNTNIFLPFQYLHNENCHIATVPGGVFIIYVYVFKYYLLFFFNYMTIFEKTKRISSTFMFNRLEPSTLSPIVLFIFIIYMSNICNFFFHPPLQRVVHQSKCNNDYCTTIA